MGSFWNSRVWENRLPLQDKRSLVNTVIESDLSILMSLLLVCSGERWTQTLQITKIPRFQPQGWPQTTLQVKILGFFGLGSYRNYVKDLDINGFTVFPGPLWPHSPQYWLHWLMFQSVERNPFLPLRDTCFSTVDATRVANLLLISTI